MYNIEYLERRFDILHQILNILMMHPNKLKHLLIPHLKRPISQPLNFPNLNLINRHKAPIMFFMLSIETFLTNKSSNTLTIFFHTNINNRLSFMTFY